MRNTIRNQLEQDGYVVLEDFLRPAECDELVAAGQELTKQTPDSENLTIFSTVESDKQQLKDSYFLESNDKISFFYESDAIGPDGKLQVDPRISLNKSHCWAWISLQYKGDQAIVHHSDHVWIGGLPMSFENLLGSFLHKDFLTMFSFTVTQVVGHALHLLHPIFRCYTYSDRVKAVCNELGLKEPAVVQSMFIYKNPGLGGEVVAHQDATYLHTEPVPAIGFWIALEDATLQNGCLWMARGSHKSGVHRRLIRNPDKESKQALIYDKGAPFYPQSSFTPVPVSKGTCILIHGHVVHKSAQNKSDKSRHAYTFHVVEKYNNTYSPENWLQEGENAPFLNLYTTPQMV